MIILQIKVVDFDDLPSIIKLQETVLDSINDKQLYFPLTDNEIHRILLRSGIIIGAFVDGNLIGFRVAYFPRNNNDNLGIDLGFDPLRLQAVVHFEASCVHPEFRGRGLQQKMGREILHEIIKNKHYVHLCSTVFPGNIPSIKDKFGHQMVIKKIKSKYTNYIRYIFYQNLRQPLTIDQQDIIEVKLSELKQQQQLLENGYCGFKLVSKNDEDFILFGKVAL